MQELNIDIETYSPVDLKKSGVYPYANHPDFEILLFAFAFGDEEVSVVDIQRGEVLPQRVINALYNVGILKTAFNAAFERTCINVFLTRQGYQQMPIGNWECTMVKAGMLGLPMSLAKVAEVLNLPQQKMGIGMSLIRYFCIPCKPTKANGFRTRNFPYHDIEKWHLFKKYCGQDVRTERNIRQVIGAFKIPEMEKKLYELDQEINDRGVLIARNFVENAINIDQAVKERLIKETIALTGINNPKSGQQLKAWLLEETGEDFDSVTKATIPDIIKKYPEDLIKKVLTLKLELNKTSVMKYKAMINGACSDNRVRGLTQFYGANRTGRWCLAEDTKILVKTEFRNIGVKNIQDVEISDKVWDGEQWVRHEGVILNGHKYVMLHDDISATAFHNVWISTSKKITLLEAALSNTPLWGGTCPRYLAYFGPVRNSYKKRKFVKTYDIINAGPKNRFMANGRIVSNSGRLVQMQNLPQNHISNLDLARNLVLTGDPTLVEMFYSNVPDTLSQLIRTSFIPSPGNLFYVADFSAIEARIVSWLADEKWRIEVFATHGKIYEASASQMFKVPIEQVTKGSSLRQKGKVSELACSYGGGVGALENMGALKMGIPKSELQGLIDQWRAANPNIVKLWYKTNSAALKVIREGGKENVAHGIYFEYKGRNLYMHLPSGRRLSYINASIGINRFGGESITYYGMDQETKKWSKQETYGAKLVENGTQAIARDCLANSMLKLDKAGYPIVFHVHDEVIIEYPDKEPEKTLDNICSIMGEPIDWAPGLLLRADGYSTSYYKKD